jgi:hypothetical protein
VSVLGELLDTRFVISQKLDLEETSGKILEMLLCGQLRASPKDSLFFTIYLTLYLSFYKD